NFSQSRLPTGWPAPLPSSPPVTAGIALSCRWKPAGGTRATVASALINVIDAQGRALTYSPLQLLLQTSGAQWHLDVTRPIKLDASTPQNEYEFTLLLLPPAPDAESFRLSLFAEEIMPTGKKQTVKVPLP